MGVITWIQSIQRDRATPPRQISRGIAIDVSRDGRQLLVQGLPRWGGHTIIQIDEPDAESKVLSESLADLWAPKFSPSQKFIAFVAGEKRKNSSIYLTDYSADSHSRFVVNKNLAGTQPFWHPTKDLLYFVHIKDTQSELYSVNVKSVPAIQISLPKLEAVIPGSTNLGSPYIIHIMAYHEGKNRVLIIEDQITNKADSTSRGNAVIIPEWRPRDLFKTPPKVLPQLSVNGWTGSFW
jgi:Tol biopolymer transport system component